MEKKQTKKEDVKGKAKRLRVGDRQRSRTLYTHFLPRDRGAEGSIILPGSNGKRSPEPPFSNTLLAGSKSKGTHAGRGGISIACAQLKKSMGVEKRNSGKGSGS